MESLTNAPRSLIFSIRLYQALLAVYPAEFRRAYGMAMLQVFRDSCRRALREAGGTGLLALWGRTTLDTVQAAIEQHSQRGVHMSKEKFYKLSGWAMIAGPLVFLIGVWAKARPPYSPYSALSMPIDRYAGPAGSPLIVFGMVCMSLGIFGILLRYATKLNRAGFLLGTSALAGLVGAAGAAAPGGICGFWAWRSNTCPLQSSVSSICASSCCPAGMDSHSWRCGCQSR